MNIAFSVIYCEDHQEKEKKYYVSALMRVYVFSAPGECL